MTASMLLLFILEIYFTGLSQPIITNMLIQVGASPGTAVTMEQYMQAMQGLYSLPWTDMLILIIPFLCSLGRLIIMFIIGFTGNKMYCKHCVQKVPVSYTHLDVYKRQDQRAAVALRPGDVTGRLITGHQPFIGVYQRVRNGAHALDVLQNPRNEIIGNTAQAVGGVRVIKGVFTILKKAHVGMHTRPPVSYTHLPSRAPFQPEPGQSTAFARF